MTANPTPPDTTQQNDGQKQADICPWDASMPLRAEADNADMRKRFLVLRNNNPMLSAPELAAHFARELADATYTKVWNRWNAVENENAKLRAELASLRAAQPDVSTVETVGALVVAQETAVRAREELARIEVLPALGRRPADPTHGERHRRIAETERAQLSRLLHLRLEIALARAIMAAFPDAVLNEPRNTPDYVGAGAGEGNASIEGSPIRDPV
jgi:hypothetical protein